MTRDLALVNYEKSLQIAKILGLDKPQADWLFKTASSGLSLVGSFFK
jgi:hypothetical protein